MRIIVSSILTAALGLTATPPAHAAAAVTITVSPTTSYSACAKVTGPGTAYFTVSFTTLGAQSRGLAAAEISDANTGGGYGVVNVCNLGGIVPTYGAVSYTVTYSTLKGSTGGLDVYCVTVNGVFACSPKSAPSVAALD